MTKSTPTEITSPVEGVKALERKFKSKANGRLVTQRLYSCPNGLALGARRGGPLHLADKTTWEVFTMSGGIVYGNAAGWVTEDELQRAVARLAAWGQDAA